MLGTYDILKLWTSYHDEHFQVPTRWSGEYKVDLTRNLKFSLAIGEWSFPTLHHPSNNIKLYSQWPKIKSRKYSQPKNVNNEEKKKGG